jgi:hypothetical protein
VLLAACAWAPPVRCGAAALRTLHGLGAGGGELLCTYKLRTPRVPPAGEDVRQFVAADIVAAGCGPAPSRAADQPLVALGTDASVAHPYLLHLNVTLPPACAAAEELLSFSRLSGAWERLRGHLLRPGAWLYLAGDSLLRMQFSALTGQIGQRTWDTQPGAQRV